MLRRVAVAVLLLTSSRLVAQDDYDARLWLSASVGNGWQGRGCACQSSPSTDPASGFSFLGGAGATISDRVGIGIIGAYWSFSNAAVGNRNTALGAFVLRYELWPAAGLSVHGGPADVRSHDDALMDPDGIDGKGILVGASWRWPQTKAFSVALTADYVHAISGHQKSGLDYQPRMLLLGLGLDVLAP